MVALTIPSEYGYVLGVAAVTAVYTFSIGIRVGGARKAANVPYPYPYATQEEADKDKKKYIFNCTQRAHQNSLEQLPVFLTLLLIGGLRHAEISAAAGAFYLVGRIIYVNGYCTGEPSKRTRGIFGMLGFLAVLGTTASTVYNLIR
ncbi:uncharacterized protein BYT42DRAFT_586018 [Radiomyces spectabilis]|uniref:uncharacterized protein n=1 Tax=Radiomyces spectabilis TaxID=64574 RepID=UPI00221F1F8E|nr:uncharacterized protein BYT42DRAFT_586018 [Radiomyces spectabilis]KAI8368277.1 hypothetical protein BYT42DRAFT_586018 [Radiomyces spectabilis]